MSDNTGLQTRFHAADAPRRAVWHEAQRDDNEFWACVAAHMLGVSEPMPLAEKRCWHIDSLVRARRAREGWAAPFFASIDANLGYIATLQSRTPKALRYYTLAQEATATLADDPYGQNLRVQIAWTLDQLREGTPDLSTSEQ